MPKSNAKKGSRNYKKEYKSFHGKPAQIKRRAQRNKARATMVKAGKAKKGDGREVDHIKAKRKGKLNNSKGNLRVVSKTTNRKKQPKRGGKKKK